ncbi:protein FAM217B, partial [Talpa occidentalis]|uniref:protein FAM217B n=1 Tax=Talpa occidentalis TaxID=50954 RepID=UPI0023F9EC9E
PSPRAAPGPPRPGGGKPFPNIRGRKKPLPQLSPPPDRLSKTIPGTAGKTAGQAPDDDQPGAFVKKGNRVKDFRQESSPGNAGPPRGKAQRSRDPSGKGQSQPPGPHAPPQQKSGPVGARPWTTGLKESLSPGGAPQRGRLSPRCQGAAGNKLFLDFESMKIMREPEEDSGSDLSDSERVPIPPSPLTPPELNLRAEEIDPICFDLHAGPGQAKPEERYPDFLPPPFNSWDLQDMASLLNTGGQVAGPPRVGGPLGRFIDRLLQLERLQVQTVQWEKGRASKARPPTAAGASVALKSPRRSQLLAGALSRPPQDGPLKVGPARKKDWHRESHAPYYASEVSPRLVGVPSNGRVSAPRSTLEVRTEEKRKKSSRSTKLQRWALSCGEGGGLRMESDGNIRSPRLPSRTLDSPDTGEGPGTQAHANLKKKGHSSNGGHAALSSEKKLKMNGAKQTLPKSS